MAEKLEGGIIIYQKVFGFPHYLLVHRNNGEWEFPKGPLKTDADPKDLDQFKSAAEASAKQLTNLDVKIKLPFCKSLTYHPNLGDKRLVKVFVAQVKSHVIVTPSKKQVMDYGWFDFRNAYHTFYYDNERDVFYDVDQFVKKQLGLI
ncbi:hypothetical protein HGK75_01145 [uncultured bacterium]|nr:hypothetical protein HGK75_01145 [uncultured bacterium]